MNVYLGNVLKSEPYFGLMSIILDLTATFFAFVLVSFIYPGESHDWLLFCLTLIGQSRSHHLIKLPLQFSTELSSSGGIS